MNGFPMGMCLQGLVVVLAAVAGLGNLTPAIANVDAKAKALAKLDDAAEGWDVEGHPRHVEQLRSCDRGFLSHCSRFVSFG